MKRGRKPVLKDAYNALAEKFKTAGLKPPPFKAYRQTPPAFRKVLEKILENPQRKLPDNFKITGKWVSCLVMPNGKTIEVSGEDLELQEE